MDKTSRVLATLLCAGMTALAANAQAQQMNAMKDSAGKQKPPAASQTEEEPSQPPALAVGALQIAPDAKLSVTSMAIEVALDRVTYAYGFRNGRPTPIDMLATVSMPTFNAADDDGAPRLPGREATNPVGLKVTNGADTVPSKAHVDASALGINRLAELSAAKIPLLPFGPETARALRELPAETVTRFTQLGLILPPDPAKPNEPVSAAWSLDVVREMQISLPPNVETMVKLSFAPIRADFQIRKGEEDELDGLKDDFCASAKTLAALRSRLKSGGAWQVSELAVDVDGPSEQIDTPAVALSVRKPRPDAIVVFCGANEKTLASDIVTGAMPEDAQDSELHIMLFTPTDR